MFFVSRRILGVGVIATPASPRKDPLPRLYSSFLSFLLSIPITYYSDSIRLSLSSVSLYSPSISSVSSPSQPVSFSPQPLFSIVLWCLSSVSVWPSYLHLSLDKINTALIAFSLSLPSLDQGSCCLSEHQPYILPVCLAVSCISRRTCNQHIFLSSDGLSFSRTSKT